MADWSMTPSDILYDIAIKLDSIEDLIYFSAVCHSWNNVSSSVKPEWSRANKQTTPWLLLPDSDRMINSGRRKVFSVARNKYYELKLPETFGARCWGTAYGWIVMLHLDKRMQLFNPITKAQLDLPPLQTMPDFEKSIIVSDDADAGYNEEWYQQFFLKRFIVLKVPSKKAEDDEYVVMAIHWPFDRLAFADKGWTPILTTCTCMCQVQDVFYWRGLVIILYIDGALAYCDISSSSSGNGTDTHDLAPKPVKAEGYLPTPNYIFGKVVCGFGGLYMVDLGGELGVVLRYMTDYRVGSAHDPNVSLGYPNVVEDVDSLTFRTCYIEVYKLDCNTKLWSKVEDLGDNVLFVGNHTTMSLQVSSATNCLKNSVYFTDDENEFWTRFKNRGRDMGVFDMSSQQFKKFYQGDDILGKWSPPTWFLPKF